jgi:hypothetical protein
MPQFDFLDSDGYYYEELDPEDTIPLDAYVLFRNGQVDGPYERGLEQDVPALLDAAQRIAQIKGFA